MAGCSPHESRRICFVSLDSISANGELLSAITFLPAIGKNNKLEGGGFSSRSRSTITDVETFKDDIYGLRNRSNRQTIVTPSLLKYIYCFQTLYSSFLEIGSVIVFR